MRRKSERTKTQASPEKTPARRSRRGRKSPSKTPEQDHKEKEDEEGDENMDRDSSSDRSSVGRTPKGRKKVSRSSNKSSDEQEYKPSRSRRRKLIKSDELEIIEENENGEDKIKAVQSSEPTEEVYVVEVEDSPPKEEKDVTEEVEPTIPIPTVQTEETEEPQEIQDDEDEVEAIQETDDTNDDCVEVIVIPVPEENPQDYKENENKEEVNEPQKSPEIIEMSSSPSRSPPQKESSRSSSPVVTPRVRSSRSRFDIVKEKTPNEVKTFDNIKENIEPPTVKQAVEPEKEKDVTINKEISSEKLSEDVITEEAPIKISISDSKSPDMDTKKDTIETLEIIEKPVQINTEEKDMKKKSTAPVSVEIKMNVDDNKEKTPEKQTTTKHVKDKSVEKKQTTSSSPPIRKRKWLSRKKSETKPLLAISTDSLKNLISDVKPIDVKLESSPEHEDFIDESDDIKHKSNMNIREKIKRESSVEETEQREIKPKIRKESITELQQHPIISTNRKVSIMSDDSNYVQRTPSPPKHNSSNILYITNLVRPFTVLQLKGLLARTGKIMENGFWIDKIKSRCYVKYETEDEATETRHALHGVRWPTSNPKCLNVDFGTDSGMTKAFESTLEEGLRGISDRGKDGKDFGWDKDKIEIDERDKEMTRPVREWDVGKKDGPLQERDREMDRSKDRLDRTGRKRSNEREYGRRRSRTPSPARKFKKKENDPPLRLLDDLFRKTKATPCIYWLPLTAEQIAVKEEMRRKHMAEHQRRLEEIKKQEEERDRERKEKEKERERERNENKDTNKERERNRSSDRRKDRSRSRERGGGGGGDRRRYR